MPWQGNGTFARIYSWVTDKNNGLNIIAQRMDTDTDDITGNGFNNCLTRDGQGFATNDLPMAGFKHTGVGAASASDQYAQVGQVQNSAYVFSSGGGTGDAITGTYLPTISTLVDGMAVWVTAPGINTVTNPTFSPDGVTAHTITKRGGSALAIGEYASGQRLQLSYSVTGTRWELVSSSFTLDILGNTQGDIAYRDATKWTVLAPGTAGQFLKTNGAAANPVWDVAGSSLPGGVNTKMLITTAGNTGTITAQAVFATAAIGSVSFGSASYSKAIDLSTTGAGGMDTGSAPTSGYVSLYAIYNPTTVTWSVLACADSTSSGLVYSGANLPSGYTASGLLGIWPTDASKHFVIGLIRGRQFFYDNVQSAGTISSTSPNTITLPIPAAAVIVGGVLVPTLTSKGLAVDIYSDATALSGFQRFLCAFEAVTSTAGLPYQNVPISTAQTLYGNLESASAGTVIVYVCSYGI